MSHHAAAEARPRSIPGALARFPLLVLNFVAAGGVYALLGGLIAGLVVLAPAAVLAALFRDFSPVFVLTRVGFVAGCTFGGLRAVCHAVRLLARGETGYESVWKELKADFAAAYDGQHIYYERFGWGAKLQLLAGVGVGIAPLVLRMAVTGEEELPGRLRGDPPVYAVAFSPDGTILASGGPYVPIKLWDAATGKERLSFAENVTPTVCSVAFSPDGKTLASGQGGYADEPPKPDPGEIKLWDVATGKELITLKGHTELVRSVAYSPDGKTLASGSEDKTIKLWDVTTGKERATLTGHMGGVRSVAFSPDGKTLASGAGDPGEIKLWDVATGKERASLLREPYLSRH
jgi:hypothetical protein